MKRIMRKTLFSSFVMTSLLGGVAVANAGGLFGEGGVIRGSIGNALKPVQERVLTPVVRGAVVGAGTTVGTVAGGYYGGPTGAVVGGTAGNALGHGVNNCFAGHC
jgi:hypothetical protein